VLRAARDTFIPSAANARASAALSPEPAPTISAVLKLGDFMIGSLNHFGYGVDIVENVA
jgi:hypothetical protein